jgi:hypothetical protein
MNVGSMVTRVQRTQTDSTVDDATSINAYIQGTLVDTFSFAVGDPVDFYIYWDTYSPPYVENDTLWIEVNEG